MRNALPQGHSCCTCTMSRRCFLGASAAFAASAFLGGARAQDVAGCGEDLAQYVDMAALRPRPEVRVAAAMARVPLPYWLGWPGTSYDVEGHRARYEASFTESAQRLGVTLTNEPAALETAEGVQAFANKLQTERPDAALITLQHMSAWSWATALAETSVPLIIFAPVGTAFTGHVDAISRQPGVHVISSLETSAVEQALRMVRAKKQFEAARMLVVAGDIRQETVLERLGTKVRYVPRNAMLDMFTKMPVTEETHAVAKQMAGSARGVIEPTEEDLLNSARSFMAAKRLILDEKSNGLTTDCLGMVSAREVPTPPCMAASLFQDGGITYGCEADLFGAISLMFVSYLFDKSGFMNDPVPETVKNVLVASHCSSGVRLDGFDKEAAPYILRSHSESNIGVSPQTLWRVGEPVTLVRFQDSNSLILDTGTVADNVDTPPAGGCRTSVEIAMDHVEDVRDVLGFHQVVFYGDNRRDVESFCQLYGIKVVNSPREARVKEGNLEA